MMDNLQEAYHAYQQALYHLPNPKVLLGPCYLLGKLNVTLLGS